MASKTPFEIRTELLSQAQSILQEKRYATHVVLENDWNSKREVYFNLLSREDTIVTDEPPAFPSIPGITTEDIIAEARKLNDFVSNG